MKWVLLLLPSLVFCLAGCRPQSSAEGTPSDNGGGSEQSARAATGGEPGLENQKQNGAWSPAYSSAVAFRAAITEFQRTHHRYEGETISRPMAHRAHRGSHPQGVLLVRPPRDRALEETREALGFKFVPPRGYLTPLPGETPPGQRPANTPLSQEEQRAANLVQRRLAHDGLLPTLLQVLRVLETSGRPADRTSRLQQVQRIGFPVDLLRFFPIGPQTANPAETTVDYLLERMAADSAGTLPDELKHAPFVFRPTRDGFMTASESGDQKIGLIRTQIGGGYNDGVTPGGTIDLNRQLVQHLDEVDFLMTVPRPFFVDFHRFLMTWPIARPGQVTLVEAPLSVSGWAQDNGKAGILPQDGGFRHATLVPRYASVDEAPVACLPGDSFVAEGLRAAGHEVVHSPLLFQGGNLLTLVESGSGQRVLLLSEADLTKNVALGLTRNQVDEAFRQEFGVDRCEVMESVSHHLDFDLSVRNQGGQTIAFVNDIAGATRLILQRGVAALVAGGILEPRKAEAALEGFHDGQEDGIYQLLHRSVHAQRNTDGQYPLELVRHFAGNDWEAPGPNFQSFLTALDLLACRVLPPVEITEHPDGPYLLQLQQMVAASESLTAQLRHLGWRIAPIPSLPDVGTPINYLNGIHDLASYLLPVHGAFYRSLDQAAMEAFQTVLGSEVKLIPIQSAESQRQHGAVHCSAVAYPLLPPPPPTRPITPPARNAAAAPIPGNQADTSD